MSENTSQTVKRGRGRPKGSKNKPKVVVPPVAAGPTTEATIPNSSTK